MARKSNKTTKRDLKGLPQASFDRVVREIAADRKSGLLFEGKALAALKEASEQMLHDLFWKTQANAEMCKKQGITLDHFTAAGVTLDG